MCSEISEKNHSQSIQKFQVKDVINHPSNDNSALH